MLFLLQFICDYLNIFTIKFDSILYMCHFFIILLGYYLQFSFNISYFLQGLPILSHLPLLFSKNVVKKLNFSAFMFVEVDHNSICFHSQ